MVQYIQITITHKVASIPSYAPSYTAITTSEILQPWAEHMSGL